MRVRSRIFFLAVALLFVFTAAVAANIFLESQRLTVYREAEREEKSDLFRKFLALKGESIKTFSYDYTFWDEMVEYVAAKTDELPEVGKTGVATAEWPDINIVTGLDTFACNAVWIYNKELGYVYSVNNVGNEDLKDFPVPLKEAVRKLFPGDTRFCHFFVYIPEGLMELRGATIHRGADDQRATPPEGYFFVGRLWDKAYVDGIADTLDCDITITPTGPQDEVSPPGNGGGVITFSRGLQGWDGIEIARINVRAEDPLVAGFKNVAIHILSIYVICLFSGLAILYFFLSKWVGRPLSLISRALREQDDKFVKDLYRDQAEFGVMSRLIKLFFEQREELVGEVRRRKEIEADLRKKQENLVRAESMASMGNWEWDLKANKIICSDGIYNICGFPPQQFEFTYDLFAGHIYPEDREMHKKFFDEWFANKDAEKDMEFRFESPDGQTRIFRVGGRMFLDEKGEPSAIFGTLQDITEHSRQEDQSKKRLAALEQYKQMTVDRENRMIELKEEINRLSEALGKPRPY